MISTRQDSMNIDAIFSSPLEGSPAFVVPDDIGLQAKPALPSVPSKVDRDHFCQYWRRKYHRLDFLYRIVKVIRSLASLDFSTLREARNEGASLSELVAKLLPEIVAGSAVAEEVRADVQTMGRRPAEAQELSLDRPLSDEILFRLNGILRKANTIHGEYDHFKKHQFFRHIAPAHPYAKKVMDLLKEVEADRALVMRRRMQFGKKSA